MEKLGLQVLAPARSQLDLTDTGAVESYLITNSPDYVIHTAAKVGGIRANMEAPFEFLLTNMLIDGAVFRAADKVGIENFLYIGSSCMYPKAASQPFKPESLYGGALEETNEAYALAKLAGSKLAQEASRQKKRNYRTLILSNLYGPGDHFNSPNSHLIAAIISKIHAAKQSGDDLVIIGGSGKPRREFTYVYDVSDWIASEISHLDKWPDLMNLGFGTDYSVEEFYQHAARVIDFTGKFKLDPSFADGMPTKLMDSSVAQENFGWSPKVSIDEGIRMTYEWWRNDKN